MQKEIERQKQEMRNRMTNDEKNRVRKIKSGVNV